MRARGARALAVLATVAGLGGGCGAAPGLDVKQAAVVYGSDDRLDYFDVTSPTERALMADSVVALIPRGAIRTADDGAITFDVPSWGEASDLCPGEPFADQPSAAFCSGVLIDRDLVLTAGHCVHVLSLSDFVVAFGYYYASPQLVATTVGDLSVPIEVVSEVVDPGGGEGPRLDYAVLRLQQPAGVPRHPTSISAGQPPVADGDPLIAISAGGGVPLKMDAGGQVLDARSDTLDFFTASTDTSDGSSGGGAFDPKGALLGVLARGAPDFQQTPAGCQTTARLPETAASEQYTYARRAVDDLCAQYPNASTLCPGGCTVGAGSPAAGPFSTTLTITALILIAASRIRRRPGSAVVPVPEQRRRRAERQGRSCDEQSICDVGVVVAAAEICLGLRPGRPDRCRRGQVAGHHRRRERNDGRAARTIPVRDQP